MHEGCYLAPLLSCQPAPNLRDGNWIAIAVILERLGLVFFDGHNYLWSSIFPNRILIVKHGIYKSLDFVFCCESYIASILIVGISG